MKRARAVESVVTKANVMITREHSFNNTLLAVFEFPAKRYFKISRLRQLPAAGKVVCKVPGGIQTSLGSRSCPTMAHQGRSEGLKLWKIERQILNLLSVASTLNGAP